MRLIGSVLLQASFLFLINQNGIQGQRLAVQKCAEHVKTILKMYSLVPLTINPKPLKCSMSIDGSVDKREFPYHVVIEYSTNNTKSDFLCGGALISEQYVLTTASCITKELFNSVRLGAVHHLRETNVVRKEIESIVRHPKYSWALPYHDIALISLNESVQFSDTIRPICLSTGLTFNGERIVHGFDAYNDFERFPKIFKRVQPPLMAQSDCNDVLLMYATRRLRNGLAKEQFCVDARNETGSIMDFGELLVKKHDDDYGCSYFLEGIASMLYTVRKPEVQHRVFVYTNVTHYLDWIESIVWSGA